MTKKEYKEYQARVESFFKKEGINNLSPEYKGEYSDPFFSWKSCDCCGRSLGGNREVCNGYDPKNKEVYSYEVCEDCIYYAEYGQLDDQTMLDIEDSEE